MSNKLTDLAREILSIEHDLPFRLLYKDKQRPEIDDFEFHMFVQTWGSTALGFGGMGGQAITSANTYVFIPQIDNQLCHVYFAGRYAYSVPYSEILMQDVLRQAMEPVYWSKKYLKAAENKRN